MARAGCDVGFAAAASISLLPRPRTPIRPRPMPEPVLPPLAPGQVMRIGPTAGTGTPTRDYGIGATDLCEFMEFPSGILQVCGDSFAGQGVGFGGWYSPIALHVDTDSIDDPDRGALRRRHRHRQAAAGRPDAAGDVAAARRASCRSTARTTCWSPPTKDLRAADLAVGESRSGAGELADGAGFGARRRLRRAAGSPRSAATTTRSRRRTRRAGGCTSWPTTSTAAGRWCCTAPTPRDLHRPVQLAGLVGRSGGGWNKPPTPLWADRVGEMSIRQIDGKTVLSYFNASTGNMEVRVADDPTGAGHRAGDDGGHRTRVARSRREPAAAGGQPAGAAVRRLHLAGIDARRAAGVHQPVEHRARGAGAVPRDPVRGEPVQALVRRELTAQSLLPGSPPLIGVS